MFKVFFLFLDKDINKVIDQVIFDLNEGLWIFFNPLVHGQFQSNLLT
jgi:hypothetical protein